jgi:hypothetical protein
VKWPIYNQSLVRRGELLLEFDVIDNLDLELKQMNKDKRKINYIIENIKVQEADSINEV